MGSEKLNNTLVKIISSFINYINYILLRKQIILVKGLNLMNCKPIYFHTFVK